MSLSYCTDCRTVEGAWREPNLLERQAYGIDTDEHVLPEDLICCECDSFGSHKGIPEHDDMDLER